MPPRPWQRYLSSGFHPNSVKRVEKYAAAPISRGWYTPLESVEQVRAFRLEEGAVRKASSFRRGSTNSSTLLRSPKSRTHRALSRTLFR